MAPDLTTLGGFELQLSLLAVGLAGTGAEVDVFFRRPVAPDHPYRQRMDAVGVRVHAPPATIAPTLDGMARVGRRAVAAVQLMFAPLLCAAAAIDAIWRRRSFGRSLRGALGRSRGLLTRVLVRDGPTFWLEATMDRVRSVRQPDVIDVQHSMIPSAIAFAVKRRVPVVYTEYGAPAMTMASVWVGLRDLVNAADHVIGRARASIDGLAEVCGFDVARPWSIVPNAVETASQAADPMADDRSTADPAEVCIAVIGRLAPEKAVGDVLEAIRRLVAEGLPVKLAVAGDGPLRHELLDRVDAMGLGESVSFLGAYGDVGDVLRRAHILAHPTRNDGRSVAVLEAMAWGRPVVGSAVGGVTELVEDGTTGLLVPPGDVEALAAALKRLVVEPDTRRSMGAAGRAAFMAGDYTVDAMVSQTMAVYRSVLAGTGRHRRVDPEGT